MFCYGSTNVICGWFLRQFHSMECSDGPKNWLSMSFERFTEISDRGAGAILISIMADWTVSMCLRIAALILKRRLRLDVDMEIFKGRKGWTRVTFHGATCIAKGHTMHTLNKKPFTVQVVQLASWFVKDHTIHAQQDSWTRVTRCDLSRCEKAGVTFAASSKWGLAIGVQKCPFVLVWFSAKHRISMANPLEPCTSLERRHLETFWRSQSICYLYSKSLYNNYELFSSK